MIPDAYTVGHRAEITLLADRYRVPAISWSRSFAELGGLISYGPVLADEYRVRRLRRPYSQRREAERASCPNPVKFELVINLKTAKALGLTVPPDKLRALADEVIE